MLVVWLEVVPDLWPLTDLWLHGWCFFRASSLFIDVLGPWHCWQGRGKWQSLYAFYSSRPWESMFSVTERIILKEMHCGLGVLGWQWYCSLFMNDCVLALFKQGEGRTDSAEQKKTLNMTLLLFEWCSHVGAEELPSPASIRYITVGWEN